jgi:sugar O-acyltransferase (sialic acid O-acetyltransferase NeuD family)
MLPELLVVGTGGLAKEAAQLARRIDPHGLQWPSISFVAEDRSECGREMPFGMVRYCDDDLLTLTRPVDVVIGVGYPSMRRRIAQRLQQHDRFTFPSLVHPSVWIDRNHVRLGRGVMICEGVVITCDVTIGDFVLLNWNVTVGHDADVGAYSVVNPSANVSGHVVLGEASFLGTGSQVLERLTVAPDAVVGAGAVVIHSIETSGTWVGVPARRVG